MRLDKTDKKILEILQENSKITNLELSRLVGLSPAPTLERVKKLEKSKVIIGYHAEVDPESLALRLNAYVLIQINSHDKEAWNSFVTKIRDIDSVISCEAITGEYDALLKILCRNMESYEDIVINKISSMPEISRTSSMFILSEIKDSKVLPHEYFKSEKS